MSQQQFVPSRIVPGASEMKRLLQAHDWSATPLGPIDGWPQSLKIVVRIMLDSRYAMWLGWGPDFTFFYNDAYARATLGAKHPWALGRSAREVWAEIWDDIGPRAESVARTGEATWDEGLVLYLERRGFPEETYHTFSYSPVPDDHGGIGGMLCVVTEDTERTIGERRLKILRELAARTTEEVRSVEHAAQTAAHLLGNHPRDLPFALVYLLDADGKLARLAAATGVADGSPAAPALVDLDAARLAGDGWPLRTVRETGQAEIVTDLGNKFGVLRGELWPEPIHTAVVLPVRKSGQDRLAGFLVVGVSPRRPLDDGYRGFFDLLAGHIATAVANARAYEEERQRAEALANLDRAKTAFFSNVSHEFRTPLTLMLGPVEDMLSRSYTDLSPAATSQLQLVQRNGLRLLRLVNTLLDFSRIEAGRVRAVYQPTDLAAFSADLASVFRAAVERAGLQLHVDCPKLLEPVYVDRDMWEKIVLNLLSNAFKFTLKGEIAVTLRRAGRNAELRVRDTGTGIPAAEMPRLFERFHRVENAEGRTHEGSGIGLALVQELVKLHGGSIHAESTVGQGTTFVVSIPLGHAHLPAEQIGADRSLAAAGAGASPYVEEALRWLPDEEAENATPELPNFPETLPTPYREGEDAGDDRPLVLVADDNADMRRYVVRLLAEHYRIEAVPDGAAALAVARERRPALVLTDVMMPRLDGFGLLRELRDDVRTRHVPVIMLSARAGEESRVEGMQAGADDYLVKPFGARELLARVSAHLQMARLRREASEALQLSHARFEALVNAAPIGIYLVDAQLRIRQVNPRALPVFGIEDLIGRDLAEVMHLLWRPDYAGEIVRRFRHTLETGVPYFEAERIEERLDCKVLEYYEWQIHRITLPDGRSGVVCYFSDISRHVLARQELAEADRRKDEFLATLAHELRNPLAPLRNSLQILRMPTIDAAIAKQTREMMERQVHYLVRLVDDLLDVSRVMRGKIELRKERLELATVVARAVETAQPLIEAQRHQLQLDLPADSLPVNADPVRLAQVVGNLLTNAAKYTEANGRICVTARREGNDVILRVRDNGIGIAPDMLPHVFELFVQADHAATRSQGGLGIGLTLVKNLAEMHHGSVAARSDGLGKGSEFVLRLPLDLRSRDAAPTRDGSATRGPAPSGQRLLVVDDNQDAANSLAMLLQLHGHEVRVAYNGTAALELAQAYTPDVVFLDIGMPGMDGYEVARRLRSLPGMANVMLAALTGWGQQEDRRRTAEAGFDHHLVKPPDPQILEALLADLKNTARA